MFGLMNMKELNLIWIELKHAFDLSGGIIIYVIYMHENYELNLFSNQNGYDYDWAYLLTP